MCLYQRLVLTSACSGYNPWTGTVQQSAGHMLLQPQNGAAHARLRYTQLVCRFAKAAKLANRQERMHLG